MTSPDIRAAMAAIDAALCSVWPEGSWTTIPIPEGLLRAKATLSALLRREGECPRWEYQGADGGWRPFAGEDAAAIEAAHKAGTPAVDTTSHHCDIANGVVYPQSGGKAMRRTGARSSDN